MKKLLVAALMVGSALVANQNAEASVLTCKTMYEESGAMLGLTGQHDYECSTTVSYSDNYSITGAETIYFKLSLKQAGLAAYAEPAAGVILTCPTIGKRALGVSSFTTKNGKERKGVDTLYGVNVAAGAMVGAKAGVLASKRGDVCTLTGIQAAFGVNLSGVEASISRLYTHMDSWQRYLEARKNGQKR